MNLSRSIRTLGVSAISALMLTTGAAGIVAQDASPTPKDLIGDGYPVSIHAGTCESPVAQPIGETVDTEIAGYDDDNPFVGITGHPAVQVASTDIATTFDELTDTPHVVALHASPDAYGTIVACGEVAGYQDDDRLVFALHEIDGSGISGIAVLDDAPSLLDRALEAIDQDAWLNDGELSLTVYIVPAEESAA